MSSKLSFYINSKKIAAPVEWADIEISALFEDNIQPAISSDSFTFVNDARLEVLQYINEGVAGGTGIFEGIDFKIEAETSDSSYTVFDGYLDLAVGLKDMPQSGRLEVGIKKKGGLDSVEAQLSGITTETLYQDGLITDSDFVDVPYVVVKPSNIIDTIMLAVSSYLLAKAVAEQIEKIAKDVTNLVAHTGGGVTGPAAGAIFAAAVLVLDIAYAIALIAALISLVTKVINGFLPIRRTHKGIKLWTIIEKAADKIGLSVASDIDEFDNLVYLSSNNSYDVEDSTSGLISEFKSISKGLPNSSDYGYSIIEIMQLVKNLFNAKFAVDSTNTLQIRSENSDYWTSKSSFVMPSVLVDSLEYNTEELKPSFVVSFDTDISDEWTIANYSGTAYERITTAVSVNNAQNTGLQGLEQVRINCCLGNRKNKLIGLENLLLGYAIAADALINSFYTLAQLPTRSGLADKVRASNNLLKVSSNNHSKPKLLYLNDSGVQPENHRDLFSAKALYEKYWSYKSFVANDYGGQKKHYRGVRIPFGLSAWLELLENSYIATSEGSESKVTKCDWRIGADYAVVDYWVKEPYTYNLEEKFIEP